MIKKLVETIVCGAIGAAALYVVGHIAYRAGQEIAREECRYEILRHENAVSEKPEIASTDGVETDQRPARAETTVPVHRKKQNMLGLLFGAKRMFNKSKTVLGDLIEEPEAHKFEAYVEGDELQIHVKRKEDS